MTVRKGSEAGTNRWIPMETGKTGSVKEKLGDGRDETRSGKTGKERLGKKKRRSQKREEIWKDEE